MKPTHLLKVLDKKTEHKVVAGVGWKNMDGSISISINPCITLSPNSDHVITLFLIDKNEPQH